MPIEVECPECGKLYRMGDHHAGRVLPCKACGAEMDVPGGRGRSSGQRDGGRRSGSRRGRESSGGGTPNWLMIGLPLGGVLLLAVVLMLVFGSGGHDEPPAPPPTPVPARPGGGSLASRNDSAATNSAPAAPFDLHNPRDSKRPRPIPIDVSRYNGRGPVPPSGIPIDPSAPLEVGTVLLAKQQGLWFIADVQEISPGGRIITMRLHGFNGRTREVQVLKRTLQLLPAGLELTLEDLPDLPELSPENSPSENPGAQSGRDDKDDQAEPSVKWTVQVDPLPESLRLADAADFTIPLDQGLAGKDVFFPPVRSPFVMVGNNDKPENERIVYDLRDRRKVGTVEKQKLTGIRELALSPDGRWIAFMTHNALMVWDVKKEEPLGHLPVQSPKGLRLTTDRVIAVDRGEKFKNFLRVWSLPTGDPEHSIELPTFYTEESLAVSPGGRYLTLMLKEDFKDRLKVYDLTTGQVAGELSQPDTGHSSPGCRGLAFSADGTQLAGLFGVRGASFQNETELWCWDVASGEITDRLQLGVGLNDFSGRNAQGWPLDWFPDQERWLAYGVAVIDRAVGEVVWTFPPDGQTSGPRRPLGGGRVAALVLDEKRQRITFKPTELPEEQLARAAAVVKAGGLLKDIHLPTISKAQMDNVRKVTVADAAGWSVRPDPAPTPPAPLKDSVQFKERPLQLGGLLLSNAQAGRAALFYKPKDLQMSSPFGSGKEVLPNLQPVWIEPYDLQKGRALDAVEVPFAAEMIGFSPGGSRVLTRIAHDQDRLDVFSADDGKHVVGWRPYKDLIEHWDQVASQEAANAAAVVRQASRFRQDREALVSAAAFIDESHVLTLSGSDAFRNYGRTTLVLWELPACRAVYQIENPGRPGISPGGKYLVVSSGGGFHFLDALTGEVRGTLKAAGSIGAAAFSTDGRRFAVTTTEGHDHRLVVWDLADGKQQAEVPLAESANRMHWCGDEYVLLNGQKLVEVDRGMTVWSYRLPRGVQSPISPDGRHWYLTSTNDLKLVAAELPPKDVRDKITELDPQPEYIVSPGATVSLQFDLSGFDGGASLRDEAMLKLAERFRQQGVNVAGSSPVVARVTVTSESGGSVDLEVEHLGTHEITYESYPETKTICRFTIEQNGQTVWQTGSTFSNVYTGTIPANETFQSRGEKRRQEGAKNFVLGVTPPKYVLTPTTADGLGLSQLGPDGPMGGP